MVSTNRAPDKVRLQIRLQDWKEFSKTPLHHAVTIVRIKNIVDNDFMLRCLLKYFSVGGISYIT